jgi:hypothetical protein
MIDALMYLHQDFLHPGCDRAAERWAPVWPRIGYPVTKFRLAGKEISDDYRIVGQIRDAH